MQRAAQVVQSLRANYKTRCTVPLVKETSVRSDNSRSHDRFIHRHPLYTGVFSGRGNLHHGDDELLIGGELFAGAQTALQRCNALGTVERRTFP